MKPIKVGLLGIGTVGEGTFNVLKRNQQEILRRAGRGIEITMVAARNTDRASSLVGAGIDVVGDPFAVVDHPDIDIVIELIGGYELPRELVLRAIANGKHVVTANKGAGAGDVARGDHGDFDAAAGAAADFFLVAFQDVKGAGANYAKADQADFDGIHVLF